MKFGYCRISKKDQYLDLQIDALNKDTHVEIFENKISTVKSERSHLNKLLDRVGTGDIIVAWQLDRLGRSVINLIKLGNKLGEQKVGFKSLNERIDTTTQGRFKFNLFASLVQLERDVISEGTNAGLEAARVNGRQTWRTILRNRK